MTHEELQQKSVTELKSYVYDAMVVIENNKANIKILNEIIASKLASPVANTE